MAFHKDDKCKKYSSSRANPGNINCYLLLWKLPAGCAVGREPYTDNSSYTIWVSISRLCHLKCGTYVRLLKILVWMNRWKWQNFAVDYDVVCCSSFYQCWDRFFFICCTGVPCDISDRSPKRKCSTNLRQHVNVNVTDDEKMRFSKARSKVRSCRSTKMMGMNLFTGMSSEKLWGTVFYEWLRWRNILTFQLT